VDVYFLIAGLFAIAAGRFGFCRPDVSLNGALSRLPNGDRQSAAR
jgi:hypothetical protein